MPKELQNLNNKEKQLFMRLLLAKQMYLHALEHSHRAGALDKMIAIHNFHNAIEVVLKTIVLHYDILEDLLRVLKISKRTFDVSATRFVIDFATNAIIRFETSGELSDLSDENRASAKLLIDSNGETITYR